MWQRTWPGPAIASHSPSPRRPALGGRAVPWSSAILLLPGTAADGSAIHITTGAADAIVTLKFSVPTLNGEPVIDITASGWDEYDGVFTKTLSKHVNYELSEFKFTLDSRIDIVDGEMVVVEKGEIKHLDWKKVGDTGYIKIEATVGVLPPTNP